MSNVAPVCLVCGLPEYKHDWRPDKGNGLRCPADDVRDATDLILELAVVTVGGRLGTVVERISSVASFGVRYLIEFGDGDMSWHERHEIEAAPKS